MSRHQIWLYDFSGRSYMMAYVALGQPMPHLSGVYVAFRADWVNRLLPEPSVVYPIYVGKADNLNERAGVGIYGHHRFDDFRRLGVTHVAYLLLSSDSILGAGDDMARVEQALYDRYRPGLINEVRPAGPFPRNALADLMGPEPSSRSANGLGGLANALRDWSS